MITQKKNQGGACCGPSCGAGEVGASAEGRANWVIGKVDTAVGEVSQVATSLEFGDRVGALKARVGVGRMHYAVEPGLYAVGNPGADSPVLVSANYKLSFDHLRSSLCEWDAWIMVLDTKGINVWCAAGKGTFGTEEIVEKAESTQLSAVVSHRTLILPQLGGPGVAAHQVKKRCGFRVVYGPVRAADLPAFMEAGMKATPEMRQVNFGLVDRLILAPIELVMGWKYIAILCLALLFIAGLGREGYSFDYVLRVGGLAVVLSLGGFLAGAVVTPALLPWLPGRAFSVKGAVVGLAVGLIYGWFSLGSLSSLAGGLDVLGWLLILPGVSAFYAMNFTGASTYTSLSGVKKEMRLALPVQIIAVVTGAGLWITSHFL